MNRFIVSRLFCGKKRNVHITESAAQKVGIAQKQHSNVSTAYLFDVLFVEQNADRCCPVCGTTYRNILITRKMGCSTCYAVFQDAADRIIGKAKIQVPYRHRLPKHLLQRRDWVMQKEILTRKMNTAVIHEQFEKAAVLRDVIDNMNKVLYDNT